MNGARLIKRKEAEARERQSQEGAVRRVQDFTPAVDTVLHWKSTWESSSRPNAREAFAALFASPGFSESAK
jgi:hypothetical protein